MRKVILYIAMTIDGMIADTDDALSFLEPYDGL
jgi:riboflavin biosynthesis pyrimidine reductase